MFRIIVIGRHVAANRMPSFKTIRAEYVDRIHTALTICVSIAQNAKVATAKENARPAIQILHLSMAIANAGISPMVSSSISMGVVCAHWAPTSIKDWILMRISR